MIACYFTQLNTILSNTRWAVFFEFHKYHIPLSSAAKTIGLQSNPTPTTILSETNKT